VQARHAVRAALTAVLAVLAGARCEARHTIQHPRDCCATRGSAIQHPEPAHCSFGHAGHDFPVPLASCRASDQRVEAQERWVCCTPGPALTAAFSAPSTHLAALRAHVCCEAPLLPQHVSCIYTATRHSPVSFHGRVNLQRPVVLMCSVWRLFCIVQSSGGTVHSGTLCSSYCCTHHTACLPPNSARNTRSQSLL